VIEDCCVTELCSTSDKEICCAWHHKGNHSWHCDAATARNNFGHPQTDRQTYTAKQYLTRGHTQGAGWLVGV